MIFLIFFCSTICGCELSHGRFEFVIDDFSELEQSEYITSENLNNYKIKDVIIRPWIKNISDDFTYSIGIYGYSDETAKEKEIYIDELQLCTNEGKELIYIVDCCGPLQYSIENSDANFVARNLCEFSGDIDTLKEYETLYLYLKVRVCTETDSEIKEIEYKIDIVEYLTYQTIT